MIYFPSITARAIADHIREEWSNGLMRATRPWLDARLVEAMAALGGKHAPLGAYQQGQRMPRIYLAGPITTYTYQQAAAYRDALTTLVEDPHVGRSIALDPLRGKKQEAYGNKPIDRQPVRDRAPYTDQFILDRDMLDVRSCDGAIVLWDNTVPSVGTAMEISLLHHYHKPMVFWGHRPDHAMVSGAVRHYVEDPVSAAHCMAYFTNRDFQGG